jgi:HlyD family secretion protein
VSPTGTADLSGLKIDRDDRGGPRSGGGTSRVWIRSLLLGAVVLASLLLIRSFAPAALPVTAVRAEALGGTPGASASEVLTASGYVVARQRASVSTEIAGRLERLYVEEGSRVRQGEVLGVLQNEDQRSAVASAKAALAASIAGLAEAKASANETGLALGRTEELRRRDLVSQSDLDAAQARDRVARARVESASADIENARARLEAATIAYDKTFIRAPFAGAVLRKEAEVGEIVSPIPSSGGLTRGAIVTMANLATLEVEVDVNEGYVARAREGMRAEITLDAYPGDRYSGRVRQIVPTADRQKATVQVKVAFDSLDARVLAAGAERGPAAGVAAPSVVIPRAAVREREGRAVVYVVEGGRAIARSVSPRPAGPDRVSVGDGIAPGEWVVVEAPAGLTENSRVRFKNRSEE